MGILGIERQFSVLSKEGKLALLEFKKAMENFRINVDPKDLEVLFIAMDQDCDKFVATNEFINVIIGKLSPYRLKYVDTAFNLIDKDEDELISIEDISRAFEGFKHPDVKLGKKRQEDLLHEILECLDLCTSIRRKPNGTYNREEFVTYYTYYSACIESDKQFEQLMGYFWKIDEIPKPPIEEQPYAGSAQKVNQLRGKDIYVKDMHGFMENETHPMRGTGKFEWDAPAYTVFDRVEEGKSVPAAGAPTFSEYKRKEEPLIEQEDMTNTELLDFIRQQLAKRGVHAIIAINRTFRRADKDHSGTLSKEEFIDCMNKMGIRLIDRNLNKIFKLFDIDNNGVISHQEFLRTVKGEMNPLRTQLVEKVFLRLDKDKNGYIDSTDIISLYDASRHPDVLARKKSEKEILAQFLDTFEMHFNVVNPSLKDHHVTMEEFKEYYNNISCSIDRDDYFELMMNQSWKWASK
eukprot:TRINITY_DN5105_c0_g1_i2.p1 TRINITY_DN5105_c0_g1~~TRINITY_DN5105_c0_g1_i2.p1  ORF type:complete len:463 (-),score=75.49 TRINITY_DN5105_c0_g1_i2:44-1432(-)